MLTQKKRLYAEARERGETMLASAIYAGCPEKTAQQAGSRYEKDPDVKLCRERLRAGEPMPEIETREKKPTARDTIPHALIKAAENIRKSAAAGSAKEYEFSDPKAFLMHVMNDQLEDPRLRVDAAKTLLPYEHIKKETGGKKTTKQNEAENLAQVSKFRPRAV